MANNKELIEKVNQFRELCIGFATGTKVEYEVYENARNELLSEPDIQNAIPGWLIKCRWGNQYWSFIKAKFSTYQERRDYINEEFSQIIDYIESDSAQPISISTKEVLAGLENNELERIWKKIHLRKENDIEGAITASRALLESTLKYILDQEGEEYTNRNDLFDLYAKVAKLLNFSPKDHNEKLFKKILGGITSIIQGFAELRNNYGDAHGKGATSYRAEARHAELTINLAGTMTTFLLRSYLEKSNH